MSRIALPRRRKRDSRVGCLHTELPTGLLRLEDPSMFFIFATLAAVLFVEVDVPAQSVTVREPDARYFVAFLLNPALLLTLGLVVIFVAWARGSPKRLTRLESLSANWFLWNGSFVHFLIDGECPMCLQIMHTTSAHMHTPFSPAPPLPAPHALAPHGCRAQVHVV